MTLNSPWRVDVRFSGTVHKNSQEPELGLGAATKAWTNTMPILA